MHKLLQHSPMQAVATSIRGGLEPGQVGAVLARAGVGKSALLVHVALTSLLRGNRVLHISVKDEQAHLRSYYDEIFGEVAVDATHSERNAARVLIERNRIIHAALGRKFGPDDLRALLVTLSQVMHFEPAAVILDGQDVRDMGVDGWRAVTAEHSIRLWMSLRTHREGGPDARQAAEHFDTAIALEPQGSDVLLQVLRIGGKPDSAGIELHLDPVSMLVRPEDSVDPVTTPPSPHPSRCSLYSGAAQGAESLFGEQAEKWGVNEVNFTFDGQAPQRDRGLRTLTERELKAGAVSMVYVAHHLGRNWESNEHLRKVLQLLWHVVSHADQVFVIGTIQADGTVRGGTGWSVELARRWNKQVWVFDQGQDAWMAWNGSAWVQGVPVIESMDFAGTGTRFVSEAGRAAIVELFERSFGS